ncbi:hypothetical protein D3C84_877970 [compost metagenome]
MWIYNQNTGGLHYSGDPVVAPRFVGYSGVVPYRNIPDKQCYQDLGPIPRGTYKMIGLKSNPTEYTIILIPDVSNDMCGRSNFLIHGDSVAFPGWASEGCIIISPVSARRIIWDSGDRDLEVRSGL